MEASVNEEIDRAAKTPGRADASDPGLLQTALLMCQLSAAVYDKDEMTSWGSDLLEAALCPVSRQITSFSPRLIHASQSSVGELYQDLGRQYGIWQVAGLGVVVAFGGTQDAQDILADGGIFKAAMLCSSESQSLLEALSRHWRGGATTVFDRQALVESLEASPARCKKTLQIPVSLL